MIVTAEMIQRGTDKAIELGLLPRKGMTEDIATNNELMLEILQAAFRAIPDSPCDSDA